MPPSLPVASTRQPLATPDEVASYRRTTESSLAQERYKGTGPKFRKLGRKVSTRLRPSDDLGARAARRFYDWADVYAWVDQNTMQRTDDRPKVLA